MGIWETLTDLAEAALPWSAVEAEGPTTVEEDKVRAFCPPGGVRTTS
jgi:ubiquinol-cytochrome c reductase subunit 6